MIRTRFKKVLLVAPEIFPNQLLADFTNVKHVSSKIGVFPAIYDITPDVIVFDYEFMGKDLERTLRRIQVNKFYNKVKICCFKNSVNENTDSFLKVLGVDHLIYRDELTASTKSKSLLNTFNSVIDASIVKWVINVTQ
ncbi:hypothetical protein [Mucilaginibacter xinganensis]|uniref:Response regulatory domain-containing protein n=1 Tax=Mucilaginibacter xinganensis TaxID=1234841 RepID=A0A223NTF6_9SPHI|nr:hypothetical protein [Mucilaginibacter xinganensis]ASU32928.1 hypothetical protein MuYL_1028 [Mucilaginibacter xinganensis]